MNSVCIFEAQVYIVFNINCHLIIRKYKYLRDKNDTKLILYITFAKHMAGVPTPL